MFRLINNHAVALGFLKLSSRLEELTNWLVGLGPIGLFSLSLLDSFIPLPGGPDLALIALSSLKPGAMLLYVLAATVGSTIGSTGVYWVARKGGEKVLGKFSQERRDRIENLLGKYDVLALVVPAILPPPFPFKVFILSAGVFKLRLPRFVLAVFAGRFVRFLAEGLLAVEYGKDAGQLIAKHGWKILIVVVAALSAWIIVRVLRQRAIREQESPAEVDT